MTPPVHKHIIIRPPAKIEALSEMDIKALAAILADILANMPADSNETSVL